MSVLEGRRITFKRSRPNPLFQDWLEELHEEAKQKKSKLETMLNEALLSLSKYPLPLESGAECAILKGFNKRLCLFLDKRLEAYKTPNIDVATDTCNIKSPPNSNNSQRSSNLSQESGKSPRITQKSVASKRKAKVKYKPVFRSGSYAILMALLEHGRNSNNQTLSKDDLINKAQKFSEESFTRPKPGTYYTAWSNMRSLISKGLVEKAGHRKSQYSLTEEGLSLVNELLLDTKNTPTVNDIIFKDLSYQKVDNETEVALVEEISESCGNVKKSPKSREIDNIQIISNSGDLVVMDPGSFDIILLIDIHEINGASKKNDPTVAQFNKFPDLKHEYRSLKVGDFTWIARHMTNNQELVLPYIVERKRMDDLGASIKDGRFHEQKFRLRKCGLNHVIYMVENYGSNKHVGLPVQSLMQSLANTRVQDGFKVQVTDSLTHSARFLAMMTLRLTFQYKDKILKGHNKEATEHMLATFQYFNKAALKNKPLSVTDTFIKLLLQLKGVSIEKALAITNVYKTPRLLIDAYVNCEQKEGEMLLANLRCGEMSRNVGPSVSKSVYQLFTFKNFT